MFCVLSFFYQRLDRELLVGEYLQQQPEQFGQNADAIVLALAVGEEIHHPNRHAGEPGSVLGPEPALA